MFDAIQNKFGFWIGRFQRKDGIMVECTNAFHDEYRARNVAERMAESYERNRRVEEPFYVPLTPLAQNFRALLVNSRGAKPIGHRAREERKEK